MAKFTLMVAVPVLALVLLVAWLTGATDAFGAPAAAAGAGAPPDPAPGTPVFHVKPASGPITVDAALDDPGWKDALELTEFFDISPGNNAPPRVHTVCRIAYDSDHIYFMARCHDPEPWKIRAHLSDRDQMFGDDFVGLMLDTFRDQRSGYEFFINPLGIQGDLTRNGDSEDESFDCLWSSAAKIDSLGWTAEFSIPTRSLRFPALEAQKWGFRAIRIWPRESRYQLSNSRIDRNNPCSECQWAVLNEFHGLATGKNLEVLPSMTMTSASTRDYLDAPRSSETRPALGLNVKYGVTPSLILDGAIHPDFAQVEADQNQVSVNSASALFFTEKRPFFLEGAGIFDSPGQFFYSRNVSDPRWAGKVTGHHGRFQLGVLAARDRSTQVILPYRQGSDALDLGLPSTDAVVRGRLGLHQESYLGVTGTARSFEGGHNLLAALDGQVRFLGRLRWIGYLAASASRDLPDVAFSYRGDTTGAARGGWATYQELFYLSEGYNGGVWYTGKSPTYRADLGYQDQNDLRCFETWHEWDFQPAGKVVDFWRPALYAGYQTDNQGVLRVQVIRPDLYMRFKGQWQLQAQMASRFTRYQNPVTGREIAAHHDAWLVNVNKQGSGLFTPSAQLRIGEDIYRRLAVLGRSSDLVVGLNVRPSSQLTASLSGELYRIRDHRVDTLLARQSLGTLRLTYQFTPRLFMRLLSQYQRVERPYRAPERHIYNELTNQFLLSYKLNYASVFFLGLNGDYHDGLLNQDDSVPAGGAPFEQTGRQLFVKFQYLWQS
jgi:hypothetical protein